MRYSAEQLKNLRSLTRSLGVRPTTLLILIMVVGVLAIIFLPARFAFFGSAFGLPTLIFTIVGSLFLFAHLNLVAVASELFSDFRMRVVFVDVGLLQFSFDVQELGLHGVVIKYSKPKSEDGLLYADLPIKSSLNFMYNNAFQNLEGIPRPLILIATSLNRLIARGNRFLEETDTSKLSSEQLEFLKRLENEFQLEEVDYYLQMSPEKTRIGLIIREPSKLSKNFESLLKMVSRLASER